MDRPMDETLDKLGATIAGALPGAVLGHQVANGWTVLGGEGTGAYSFTAVDRALMS